MANESDPSHESVGAWAKRYYFAGRALAESVLRPYDLGWTQWHVLYQLAHEGPTMQKDVGTILEVERPTLSGVVTILVRKGLIEQVPDAADQRQRLLRLTDAGRVLWETLPNPIDLVLPIAFDGIDDNDLMITRRTLQVATRRLSNYQPQGKQS